MTLKHNKTKQKQQLVCALCVYTYKRYIHSVDGAPNKNTHTLPGHYISVCKCLPAPFKSILYYYACSYFLCPCVYISEYFCKCRVCQFFCINSTIHPTHGSQAEAYINIRLMHCKSSSIQIYSGGFAIFLPRANLQIRKIVAKKLI